MIKVVHMIKIRQISGYLHYSMIMLEWGQNKIKIKNELLKETVDLAI